MRKTFVLDTSVLLAAGRQPLTAFAEHEVVIPLVVLNELEAKRDDPELGWTARSALRAIESYRTGDYSRAGLPEVEGETLKSGITVNAEGGTLRIEVNHVDQSGLPDALARSTSHDTRILAVAANLRNDGAAVTVVSQDLPMRVKAGAVLSLDAEEYRRGQAREDSYTGLVQIDGEAADIDQLRRERAIDVDVDGAIPTNTGLVLDGALAVYRADKRAHLINGDREAFGVHGKSAPQRVALDHLLNMDVGVVSLGGPAGTGKTMLALAAGLDLVMEQRRFQRIVVFRNMHAVGQQELGYLPGTEAEKMSPWTAAVWDAVEAFCGPEVVTEIQARNLIEVLPLTHIRGRTLTNTYIVIDEAQNLERSVILTALSRLGEGSKAVLSWDVGQRDNLHVGRHDGIQAVVEKMVGEPLFAHVSLTKSERSAVAAMVTRVIDDLDV